jgi:hypothetical protein
VYSDDEPLGLTGCVTFARGLTERAVFERFDMAPESARPLAADEVRLDPVLGTATEDGPFWVRVARIGDWSAAIEWLQLGGYLDNIAARLSLGTEAVSIAVTAKGSGTVNYFVDGDWTTCFELGAPYDTRAGSQPDRFHQALVDVGLAGIANGTGEDLPLHRQIVATLTMLTNEFGIRLPHAVYQSALPTAYRTHRYTYQPPR